MTGADGGHVINVPFLDLAAQHRPLRQEILAAWEDVYDSTRFVGSREVEAFELSFAEAHETAHCVAVSSGTDALHLGLLVLGVGPGDEVVVPANTFIATAEAVSHTGATPRFVDCDPVTMNIDVAQAAAALENPTVKGLIGVHLYGQPCDLDPLLQAAERRGCWVVEDAAQAHLARYRDRSVGGLGRLAGFSFYPGKNLGAPGEGGAILTNDDALAGVLAELRDHGQTEKYKSSRIGFNSRMHELVGATLNVKLPHLTRWTERRRAVADRYRELLSGVEGIRLPVDPDWAYSVYHLFVVHVPHRERVMELMLGAGVGVSMHYPIPIHLQEAYASLGHSEGDFPVAEQSASSLLSLPMYAELTDEQVDYVAESLRSAVAQAKQ